MRIERADRGPQLVLDRFRRQRSAQDNVTAIAVEIGRRVAERAIEGLRLVDGGVVLLARIGVGRAFFHAGDFADDGSPGGLHLRRADPHPLADGVLPRPGLPGEFLVHHHDQLRLRVVVSFSEQAAAEQPNAHGTEHVALNLNRSGEIDGARFCRSVAFGDEGGVALVSVGGQERGKAGAGNARDALHAAQQFLIELVDRGLRPILLARQAVGGDDGVIGPIAEVGFAHLFKAAQQKTGSGEQYQRDSNFRNDQAGAQARMTRAGGAGAAAFLQGLVDAGANRSESRRDATEHAGNDGQREREGGDHPVEADAADQGQRLRQKAAAKFEHDGGEDEAEDAAAHAEDETLEQRLAEERACAGTEREPDRNFAAAADGADEKKSGQVGAGDEQHDRDGKEEGADERTGLRDGVLMQPVNNGCDLQAGHEGRVVTHRLPGDAIGVLASLFGGDARLEAADHAVAPVGLRAAVELFRAQAHRDPQLAAVEMAGDERKFEIARHDADHDVRLAVEEDLLAEDARVAVEAALPGGVAENGDLLALRILVGGVDAAQQGAPRQGR